MISESICSVVHADGRELRRTTPGGTGYLIYGPYVWMTHGVYQADFELALGSDDVPDDAPCAVLDVTGRRGEVSLGKLLVRTSDLSPTLRRFSIFAVLRHIFELECRVYVNGAAQLLVDPNPVLKRISGVLDEEPRPELGQLAHDLDELGRDTRRILRTLRPHALKGFRKIRLGNPADGGYVCVDDFTSIDTALSLGINDDISWDLDVAERGPKIYQFDHTVSDPAPDDPRMVFAAKRIDRSSGPGTQSLLDLIQEHDNGGERPNLILKMDIEGSEWDVLDATPAEALSRLAWIVCELHYFQGLAEQHHRTLIDRSLEKLSRHFGVVHVHSNVWGGYTSIANTIISNVIEVTFANLAYYDLVETSATFPTILDQSCDPRQPDFYLGSFRF